jgi:transcriptional regulator
MYIPSHFREGSLVWLQEWLAHNPFGTLVTSAGGTLSASHVPMLLRTQRGQFGELVGHLARDNPQSECLALQPVLAIFTGVHGYISPTWYVSGPAVPTWNYEAVQVTGTASLIEGAELSALVDAMTDEFEREQPNPWSTSALPLEMRSQMETRIVGFRIPIDRIEGKRKLSQNRSLEDRRSAIDHLREGGEKELADAMQRTFV